MYKYDPGREFIIVLLKPDIKAFYRGYGPEIGWMADMTDVLHAMAQEGYPVTTDMVATFSPYLREHIKRFGEYVIDLETTHRLYSQTSHS